MDAAANMKLQELIYSFKSQDITARAIIRLKEQGVAAGVKMWLQDKLFKSSLSQF